MKKCPIIFCKNEKGSDVVIKASCVESYVILRFPEDNMLSVNFISGNSMLLQDKLDQEVYPGECLATVLDDLMDDRNE